MALRSSFAPGGNGMTRGGLDRYLGPSVMGDSNIPESLQAPEHPAEPVAPVDCSGADKGEAVCQIAAAEKEIEKAP